MISHLFLNRRQLSLSSAHFLVLLVPVLLLALDGAVGSVPTAPVDGLRLAVETLKKCKSF